MKSYCFKRILSNHWSLVVINPSKGAAFWIDPLKNRIDGDMSEVLEMYVIPISLISFFCINYFNYVKIIYYLVGHSIYRTKKTKLKDREGM